MNEENNYMQEVLQEIVDPESEVLQEAIENMEQTIIKLSLLMVTIDKSSIGIAYDIHGGISSALWFLRSIKEEARARKPEITYKNME